MQIHLRERDLDALPVETVVYGLVQFVDRVQTVIHAGEITAEDEVQRAVAEGFEGDVRMRIV